MFIERGAISINPEVPIIDVALVHDLVGAQFPEWADLPIEWVPADGWDNRSFRLGTDMVVRLPSAASYAAQVEKEHQWLPVLARFVSFPIPVPLALGRPTSGYPWHWSIYRWLSGEPAQPRHAAESATFAAGVATFLAELQSADPTGGPPPGPHNFYRGGLLSTYDAEVREAIRRLEAQIDADAATATWDSALQTSWARPAVWIHGDISLGNLLSLDGRLSGVLDFGSLGVGDPACDVSIAWTVFRGDARKVFRTGLRLDPETWLRGRAWALWKGLIVAAGLTQTNAVEWVHPLNVVGHLLSENDH